MRKKGSIWSSSSCGPPIGVTALQAGEVDYSAAGGLSVRAAMKGLPLRTIMFIQTRLSFSLIGQPGMLPPRIKSGVTVTRRIGRNVRNFFVAQSFHHGDVGIVRQRSDRNV